MTKRKDWPEWLRDAKTRGARVKITADGAVIWRGGVWRGGVWLGGDWLAKPVQVLDLGHDTRGYPRSLQRLDGVVRLRAGCHLLTLDEAEHHWGASYPDRTVGDDYLALIAYARTAAVQRQFSGETNLPNSS